MPTATHELPDLTRAIELAGVVIFEHDLASDRVRLNHQAAALFGLDSSAETMGIAMAQLRTLLHPEDAANFLRLSSSAEGDRRRRVETRFLLPGGGWGALLTTAVAQFDAQGHASTTLGVALDVTERRRTELALSQAHERAALSARGAGLGTWGVDLGTGLATWDEQMWRLRGREPQAQAPSAEQRLAFVHADDRAPIQQRLDVMSESMATGQHEFRVVWPDGQVRWLASKWGPVRDAHGRIVRRIGVNWDITDTRTADAARQEREVALRESRAKTEFLARMSHKLRTPLNAVLGFAQLLLVDETGSDAATASKRRRLEHVRAAGQHLLTLINEVLDLASVEGGQAQLACTTVALEPLALEVITALEPMMARRGVSIHCAGLQAAAPRADAVRLRQMLQTLLGSALRHSHRDAQLELRALRHAGRVLVNISAPAPMLSDDELGRIFEPFNGVDDAAAGELDMGIGLTMAKALAEHMGGSLRARSTASLGIMFELELADGLDEQRPHAGAPAAPRHSPGAPDTPAASSGIRGTLLYIEDNPVNALIVAELVARRSDLKLHVAITGTEGVNIAGLCHPDLILLDMQLPDIDGYEVLKRLRARADTAATPVVALSANAMPQDIERGMAAGLSDYWTKPLDFNAFTASIEVLFGPAR